MKGAHVREFSLDEIYGPLDEYCEYHQMTIDQLIEKNRRDIEILFKRYQEIASQKEKFTSDSYEIQLAQARRKLIEKKRKHLQRLIKWKEDHQ